jgi:hypothetical protein
MIGAVIAAAGLTAVAFFFFAIESERLTASHARPRTQILNALRWGIVIALCWVLIPAAVAAPPEDRLAIIIGLGALVSTLMLLPLKWLLQIGGREKCWELRRAKLDATKLANEVRRSPGSVSTVRISDMIDRVQALRTPEVEELCDLIVAELEDMLAGTERWNEAGRRAIRLDQLSRKLWPDDLPPPDYDPEEATFRWKMYRTFGQLMEVGVMDVSSESRDEFQKLLGSLHEFERDDTKSFIENVVNSGTHWLSAGPRSPWIESFDFRPLGPNALDEVRRIWGRDAAMWGARLEDQDREALEADLAKRSASD